MIYYVETGVGCTITEARNIEQARRNILSEVGTYAGVKLVRKATDKDIAWVAGMGGYLPKAAQHRLQRTQEPRR